MLLVIMLMAVGVGCGGGAHGGWEREHGGVVLAGGSGEKAERALGRLGETGRGVFVGVLGEECPCAYAWGDRRVYVTRGLVELLDERELVAAVAHEVGHLIDGGHLECASVKSAGETPASRAGGAALSGRGCEEGEVRADEIGVRVMEEAGVEGARGVMVGMLGKVKAAVGGERGEAVGRRMELLAGEGNR